MRAKRRIIKATISILKSDLFIIYLEMEKLIELLNEYDDGMVSWYEEYFSTEGLFVTNAGQGFREEFILGKRYGFIKWLVENDKIDLDMIPNVFTSSAQDRDEVYYCMRDIKDFSILNEQYGKPTIECLLMLLSIQDEPIEFLVSILK